MQTFSIHDLQERSGELSLEAEAGHLSLITKHGNPLVLALPFSDSLMDQGAKTALAEYLFKEGILSLGKAAKIAAMPYVLFSEHLSRIGISVVNYSADELEEELAVAKL